MAVTREEKLLNSLANGVPSDITPITREEQYLSYIGGGSYSYPLEPITRKEALLKSIAEKGVSGGGGVTINNQNKTITENGTYTADSGYTGLGTVTVDVQASGGGENKFAQMVGDTITTITAEDLNGITAIGGYAFYHKNNLVSAASPSVTSIGTSAFGSSGNLVSVNFPSVTSIGENAFNYCSKLTSVDFPLATSIGNNAFDNCSKLASANFPSVTSIANSVFQNNYSLVRVILRSETICTLANKSTFSNCYHFHGTVNKTYNPEGLQDGYIYVPSALVESYKTATNWSNFATQFRALEDYTVDGTITGALDESKI